MKRSATTNNLAATIPILSVSPYLEDEGALQDIGRDHFVTTSDQNYRFELVTTRTPENATNLLRTKRIPIAICERDCAWRELLEQAAAMP